MKVHDGILQYGTSRAQFEFCCTFIVDTARYERTPPLRRALPFATIYPR